MPISIGFKSVVLNAYAVIAGAKPGYTALQDHLSYVSASGVGVAGYTTALNTYLGQTGLTDTQLATSMLANLGLSSVFTVAEGEAYLKANAANKAGAMLNLASLLQAYAGTDAKILAAKTAYVANIDASDVYSSNVANTKEEVLVSTTGRTSGLTGAVETVVGTAFDDTFNAYIRDNQNTLQSGDNISGGAGTDTLYADIGSSQNVIITAITSGVELVKLRAQAVTTLSGDNNITADNQMQIDAERMAGVTWWESNNSRADVIVEDVRIAANQITKDITVAMVETDPGHVDFGVYFNQLSLRNSSASTSQIRLQVMDTKAVVDGKDPLLNSPYSGFRFTATDAAGVSAVFTLQSQAIDDAQTYAQLVAAFQAAADAAFGKGAVTVALGSAFTVTDTTTGKQVAGTEVNITATGTYTFTTPSGSGWLASGVVPANSGLHTNFFTGGTTSTDPVTVKVVLDDVGLGSTGGDLVIGGMSVGDTSTSKGVERFEVEVRDNSKLQTINSTNNTLKEVVIVNGATSSQSFAYVATTKDAGNLTVNGNVGGAPAGSTINNALPGSANQHNAYGFSDVRLIDGSALKGKLAFTAEFTDAAIAKYLNLTDTAAAPSGDNVAVAYSGGVNGDTMVVRLDSATTSSNNSIRAGREDFTFTFNGNGGDDTIEVAVAYDTATTGYVLGGSGLATANANWYTNQKLNANVTVNGGDGNDTVKLPGSGDVKVDLGAGNDTVYSDNTAAKAVWVLNSADQTAAGVGVFPVARQQGNVLADSNETYNFFNATVAVTFKGFTTATAVTVQNTGYKTSDLEINQAVKKAINDDAVLSKMLVAKDGPFGSLVVESLVDGASVDGDLSVALSTPAAGTLSATDIAAAVAVYTSAAVGGTTDAALVAYMGGAAALGAYTGNGDYVARLANNGTATVAATANATGANSVHTSDNTLTGGAGNDVYVLSTATATAGLDSSNETLKFSAGFGSDSVLYFSQAGNGADVLDFDGSWTGNVDLATAGAAIANTDLKEGAATIVTFTQLDAAITGTQTYAGLDTLTLAQFNEAFNANAAALAAAGSYLILVQNAANTDQYKVFSATAAVGATTDLASVTFMGEVELPGTTAAGLVAAGVIV